jgi:lipopolysaccharide transport system ATP-binding protein
MSSNPDANSPYPALWMDTCTGGTDAHDRLVLNARSGESSWIGTTEEIPMSENDISIRVVNLGKCYQIYDKPRDRLLQMIMPRLYRVTKPLRKHLFSSATPVPTYYKEFWALRDISFEVKKGETVGVIGRNGSGKSTLLQMISGTLNPTGGSVQTKGRIAALLELGSGFNPEFSGRENVYMNGAILGFSTEEIDNRFGDIAAFADVGDFIEQPVKTYSSGMLIRLAFAVSVCVEPDILILDEALAVGDAAFQFKCLDRLRALTSSGTTLLFVSHDMGMVKNFCHRVLYLQAGQEKARGTPDEMAELYFLDMRDEQRRYTAGNKSVMLKPFVGKNHGMAFGTEQGHVVSACFTNSRRMFSSFMHGEEVEACVETRCSCTVPHPFLSMIVQDRKMMDVAGQFFPLDGESEGENWNKAITKVRFKANLAAGRYHITVRLENRLSETVFQPIDKQVGLLSFEVLETEKAFLGVTDIGMCRTPSLRIVALLTIRNETRYLPRCLKHLSEQGVEICVVDNESTDDSRRIAEQFRDRGVFRIETQPFRGFYDHVALLRLKEKLSREICADWFIHCDADEIREAPAPFKSLRAGIMAADQEGFTAINFDEFVFLPTTDEESFEGTDYVQTMQHYYFFEPEPLRRVNAWKNIGHVIDLVSSGGHKIEFAGRKIYPVNFILRHYIVLSRAHAIAKYGRERIYSREEIEQRNWHGPRANFDSMRLRFPSRGQLQRLSGNGLWDRTVPFKKHSFLGA